MIGKDFKCFKFYRLIYHLLNPLPLKIKGLICSLSMHYSFGPHIYPQKTPPKTCTGIQLANDKNSSLAAHQPFMKPNLLTDWDF